MNTGPSLRAGRGWRYTATVLGGVGEVLLSLLCGLLGAIVHALLTLDPAAPVPSLPVGLFVAAVVVGVLGLSASVAAPFVRAKGRRLQTGRRPAPARQPAGTP